MSYPYPVNSSGVKTSSSQVSVRNSFLAGIDMKSPTTGVAVLSIYDSNNGALGNVLAEFEIDAGMPSCNHEYTNFVIANSGIYASLNDPSGTANFIIRYCIVG